MRYFLAIVIPVAFVILVFSVLAILTALADGWSPGAQNVLAEVVVLWAHYWWVTGMVMGSIGLIWAVVSDVFAPAKRKPR